MKKSIDPTTHAALDYGLAAIQVLGPEVLGLSARACAVSTVLGATYGATTAITDTELGVKPIISFQAHGALEVPFIAANIALPWLSGACRTLPAKLFFVGCSTMAIANFLMTDFTARKGRERQYGVEDVRGAAEEALAPLLRT
jgi:hypothetical protein